MFSLQTRVKFNKVAVTFEEFVRLKFEVTFEVELLQSVVLQRPDEFPCGRVELLSVPASRLTILTVDSLAIPLRGEESTQNANNTTKLAKANSLFISLAYLNSYQSR